MAAPDPIPDLLKSVNDASSRAFALWLSFMGAETYLAISVGTTTHRQLLLGGAVKLPLLTADLPLFAFYELAPPLFVVLHLYVLMQLYLLSRSLRLFDVELRSAQMIRKDRERIRSQLDDFVFTQLFVGVPDGWTIRLFLRLTIGLSFLVAPVLLLLAFQLQFLPYHDTAITYVHRAVILLDVMLLWVMWPKISQAGAWPARLNDRYRHARRYGVEVICIAILAFSILVATIPNESIEQVEMRTGWVVGPDKVWFPTWALFGGGIDRATGRARSLFARNLILFGAGLVEPDRDKLSKVDRTLSLRARDLRLAMLDAADLRKSDLTGAYMVGADLVSADLTDADLTGADLTNARLVSAKFNHADLTGTILCGAQLVNADFNGAILKGADLSYANLTNTDLTGASLSGADLSYAILTNTKLAGATLTGADLTGATRKGADFSGIVVTQKQLESVRTTSTLPSGVVQISRCPTTTDSEPGQPGVQ